MSKRERDGLLRLVESYFDGHLQRARGASPHTLRAYGHALRLFFLFLAKRFGGQSRSCGSMMFAWTRSLRSSII